MLQLNILPSEETNNSSSVCIVFHIKTLKIKSWINSSLLTGSKQRPNNRFLIRAALAWHSVGICHAEVNSNWESWTAGRMGARAYLSIFGAKAGYNLNNLQI